MTEEKWDLPDNPPDDFDFVEAYDDEPSADERMLEENTAPSAINCAFVGVGGGGGKLAKAFLDLGFNKTLLVNTTEKDQLADINPENFILIPGADGVGKDVKLGKEILSNNSALVEDATIKSNCEMMLKDINKHTHIIIDNEKQLQLLRGKVGMLNMYPAANKNFAKLLAQVFKLADEASPIQAFDSKDLERCLKTPGRMLLGSTVVRDPSKTDLGSSVFQGCLKSSPCPTATNKSKTGALLLIATPDMADDPAISNRLEAAFSYVGGRADTLFSGVYIRGKLPGLIALTLLGGIDDK